MHHRPRTSARSAGTLLITLIALAGIATLVFGAIDMQQGRRRVAWQLKRQQETDHAAFTFASLIESRLKLVAEESQLRLTMDNSLDQILKDDWLRRGFVDQSNDNEIKKAKGCWLGDKLIYWRVEPVVGYDHTLSAKEAIGPIDPVTGRPAGKPTDFVNGGYSYMVNYEADLSSKTAPPALPGTALTNPGIYLYQITVNAYAIRNYTNNGESTPPAAIPNLGDSLSGQPYGPLYRKEGCTNTTEAQSQIRRKVIVNYRRLFEYIIFYNASDMELHPGPELALVGAVHSNGAMYLGLNGATVALGSSNTTTTPPQSWAPNLGQVHVSAVNGIFRMKKQDMIAAGIIDPMTVAIGSALSDTSGNRVCLNSAKLNYSNLTLTTTPPGQPSITTVVPIPTVAATGTAFLPANDSRKANQTAGTCLQGTDANLVRDGMMRTQSPKILKNVSGALVEYHPLEPFALVKPNSATSTSNLLWDGTQLSIRTGTNPVGSAVDMPLFWLGPKDDDIDVWPGYIVSATTAPNATYPYHQDLFPLPAIQASLCAKAPGVPMTIANVARKPDPLNLQPPSTFDFFSNLNAYIPRIGPTCNPQPRSVVLNRYIRNPLGLSRAVTGGDGITILERGQQIRGVAWPSMSATDWRSTPTAGRLGPNNSATVTPRPPVLTVLDYDTGGLLPTPMNPYGNPNGALNPEEITLFLQDYCQWLRTNYVVYFGIGDGGNADLDPTARQLLDITDQFFSVPPEAASLEDLVVHEDAFIDRREALWLAKNGYVATASQSNVRVNVLTLNMAAFCTFIKKTPENDLIAITDPKLTGSMASARFNGAIYLARTPRYCQTTIGPATYYVNNPFAPLGFYPGNWVSNTTPGNYVTTLPFNCTDPNNFTNLPVGTPLRYPVIGHGVNLTMNGYPTHATVNFGETNVWATYPMLKRVRIKKASFIDWGGIVASGTTGRTQGVTIYTPDPCYIQGDYNLVADSKGCYPPCAIYCDNLAVQSNNWDDATVNANPTTMTKATNTVYRVAVVLHNVPSDKANVGTISGVSGAPGVSDEGSGGTHNVIKYLEDWGSITWCYIGSIVVLDRSRYTRGYNNGSYGAPTRKYMFNADLCTAEGQPPFAEYVVDVTSH